MRGLAQLTVVACRAAGICVLASGCDSEGSSPRAVVRDSAGVTIVENPAAAADRAAVFSIDSTASVTIGSSEGDPAQQLFRVMGAARLADGRIAILNAGSSDLRIFDGSGRHVITAGRKGAGPGEFQLPAALLHLPHDTLAVWDRGLQRVTVFSPDGGFVRTVRLDAVGDATTEVVGLLHDASLVLATLWLDVPETGFKPVNATLVGYSLDDAAVDTIVSVPWREIGILYPEDAIVGSRTFAPRTAATARGAKLWVGSAAEPSIVIHDSAGAPTRIIRWDAGDRSVAAGAAEAYFDATSPSAPPERRRAFASIPVMERYPAHGRLLVDASDHLWVERYPRPLATEPTEWWIFDADGSLVARTRVPADLRILEIGEDAIVGVRRDAEGVERVTVHALRRR